MLSRKMACRTEPLRRSTARGEGGSARPESLHSGEPGSLSGADGPARCRLDRDRHSICQGAGQRAEQAAGGTARPGSGRLTRCQLQATHLDRVDRARLIQ